jgi:hypothetical protein
MAKKSDGPRTRTVGEALEAVFRRHITKTATPESARRGRRTIDRPAPARPQIPPQVYRMLWDAGIIGVGFGIKESAGSLTPVLAARVYVQQKKPLRNIERRLRVPEQILGSDQAPPIDTDVVAVGRVRPLFDSDRFGPRSDSDPGVRSDAGWLPKDLALLRSPLRPLQAGTSIGPPLMLAGTLGCFVRPIGGGGPHMLSNNHVLAGSRLRIGSGRSSSLETPVADGADIFQPGLIDASEPYILEQLVSGAAQNQPVGKLSKVVPIQTSDPRSGPGSDNFVDAAIAEIGPAVTSPTRNPIFTMPTFLLQPPPDPYDRDDMLYRTVMKVGRTTGATLGVVVDTSARLWIPYGAEDDFDRYAVFANQLVVLPIGRAPDFSASGDSGSSVFDARTSQLIGLLFAGSDAGYTILNPIDRVFQELSIVLV